MLRLGIRPGCILIINPYFYKRRAIQLWSLYALNDFYATTALILVEVKNICFFKRSNRRSSHSLLVDRDISSKKFKVASPPPPGRVKSGFLWMILKTFVKMSSNRGDNTPPLSLRNWIYTYIHNIYKQKLSINWFKESSLFKYFLSCYA